MVKREQMRDEITPIRRRNATKRRSLVAVVVGCSSQLIWVEAMRHGTESKQIGQKPNEPLCSSPSAGQLQQQNKPCNIHLAQQCCSVAATLPLTGPAFSAETSAGGRKRKHAVYLSETSTSNITVTALNYLV